MAAAGGGALSATKVLLSPFLILIVPFNLDAVEHDGVSLGAAAGKQFAHHCYRPLLECLSISGRAEFCVVAKQRRVEVANRKVERVLFLKGLGHLKCLAVVGFEDVGDDLGLDGRAECGG